MSKGSLDDHAMGKGGDMVAAKIKRLITDAEQPLLMMTFLQVAIEQYAFIIADGDPDIIASYIKTFRDGASYVACAKHILLQRAADWRTAEEEVEREMREQRLDDPK
jgi:hypothetical protein